MGSHPILDGKSKYQESVQALKINPWLSWDSNENKIKLMFPFCRGVKRTEKVIDKISLKLL